MGFIKKDRPVKMKRISGKKERVKEDHGIWEEFFSIYSGGLSTIHFKEGSRHKIDTDDNLGAVVTLSEEAKLSNILHDAFHLKDTLLLKDLRKIPELNDALDLPFVTENFEIMREAQIDWHATDWFNKDVFGAHASEIRRQLRKKTQQPCQAGVANVVYDVNRPVKLDAAVQAAIRICYDDIIQSRESDDKFAPLKAAIEIGRVIRDLQSPMAQESFRSQKDNERQKVLSFSLQKGKKDEHSGQKKTQEQHFIIIEEEMEIDPESDDSVSLDLSSAADQVEKARKKYDQLQNNSMDRKNPDPTLVPSEEPEASGYSNSHEYRVDKLKMVGNIELNTTLNRMTGELAANDSTTRVTRSGIVTPKAWKINFGEIRVFTKPPFTLKRVVAMVDLSESMGCWCQSCCDRSGFAEGKSKAWMALQVATAIGKAFPDTTEMFGFSSDEQCTHIYPLEIGKEPICRRLYPIAMGTPLCVALKHLEEKSLSLDATMAVLITDGDPGTPAPLSSVHMREHTETLSEELFIRGLRYCTVIIGEETRRQLFPEETVIRVRVPSDFYKLQEMLVKLSEERHERWQRRTLG